MASQANQYTEENLNMAFKSMEISKTSYFPLYIEGLPNDPNQIIAYNSYCHLNPDCYYLLPFPMPPLSKESIEGIEAEVMSTVAELPLFIVYPMATPILCCLLTGKPSDLHIRDLEKERDLYSREYERLYHESGLNPHDFLKTKDATAIVNNMIVLRVTIEEEKMKLASRKSEAWPLCSSSYKVCTYYQKIINILLAMSKQQSDDYLHYISECYEQLRHNIDGLLHDHLAEGSDFAMKMGELIEAFDEEFVVYNDRVLPNDFEQILLDYTSNVISFMEQCIMAMIGVFQAFREKLVHTVQGAIDVHSNDYYGAPIMADQHRLSKIRYGVAPEIWSLNERIVKASETTPAIFATKDYQVWMFNQLVCRVHKSQDRRLIDTHDFIVQRAHVTRPTTAPIGELKFY
ncbi:MAG: hypothetical protein BVN35_05995 [Proteobacteria bacterium ST_bin11]|nr:MAG: hypothetical protein BVN35_05995 [Proteobacteria bacterium ST_bin11]